MILNVDPGGKSSSFARESSGVFGSSFRRSHAARISSVSCDDSSFGSNVGLDTMARMSPVPGSSATTAPGWVPSAAAATRCRLASTVVMTWPPFFGRPSTRSASVETASSGASPDRYVFIACSSSVRP